MHTETLFKNGFIQDPESIEFDNAQTHEVYSYLYSALQSSDNKTINADKFLEDLSTIYEITDLNKCRLYFIKNFLSQYPEFFAFIQNMNADASVDTECSEKVLKVSEPHAAYNCSAVKSVSNSLHNARWSRAMLDKEKQGSVSILGKISESLLQKQLEDIVNDDNHFYNSSSMPPQIRLYGDFVVMCQPNNLWLSVKSSFARERLLASGYTNDLIGVGFFQDAKEFTNLARLRNFKKAGFLAIYVPSVPVTEEQVTNNVNTYDEVVAAYGGLDKMPQNIGGTQLIRDLSELHNDLKKLTDVDIKDRNLTDF